ncbi:MAG: ABC transporter substrate-binding protein [Acidimicrobiia bacterium]|nr:ABC transporter substrate-binding protein [Acidimicrobiia bacterium]
MRSTKMAAIAIAMMLVSAGCGARLTKDQLAKAAAGGGQVASAGGATSEDSGAAAAGDQSGGAAAGSTSGGGGATSAAGGGSTQSAAGANQAQGGAGACASQGGNTDVGVTSNSITLANVSLLTGPVPGLFKGAKDGTQAFFNYMNSQGGVCGRKLNLDARDDQFDVNQNKAQYEDAIGKDFGFVGSFSVVDQGGSAALQAHPDVPDVAYALSHEHSSLPNNFSPQPLPPGWRLGSLNYFKAKFGPDVISKMAILIEDAQSAKDAADGEMKAARSVGYNFVYSRVIEPTEANFTSDVVAMQQKGVKGIMMTGEVGAFVRVAKAMKQQGFSVPFANWGANAYDPAFITSDAAPATNGSLIDQQLAMFQGEDAIPEVQLFNKWLKQVGGKPDIFAAFGWESARLFVQALQAAGPKPTRANVMAQLKQIDNFDGNGMLAPAGPASKRPPTCFIVIGVQNGKFVRSDPPSGFLCNQGDYFHA